MPSSEIVLPLVAMMKSVLESLDDERVEPFLALWPTAEDVDRVLEPRGLPVLGWLETAVSSTTPQTYPLAAQLANAAPHLAWGQTYSASDFGADFLSRYGWTELIGLRGPIASDQLGSGFLLLAPQLEYPLHSHQAEEIYLPLTEPTRWLRGNEPWQTHPAGQPIHHPAWLPHAMHTETTPLLALYLWRNGNLTQKSRIH
ncbi:MAG: dimethylsulfonioproprionate lyase family protein [Chloroflexota bacterium]